MLGAEMYTSLSDWNVEMQQLKGKLAKENKNAQVILAGASDHIGCFGYINCFREIINQNLSLYTDIVVPYGSGGTVAGLAIGNHLYGSPVKIHCISTIDNSDKEMKDGLQELIDSFNLQGHPKVDEIINFMPSGIGIGYKKSTDEEM